MNRISVGLLAWALGTGASLATGATLGAEPLVLVNTLADRPVLSWVTDRGTVTRSVAPGQKVSLEALRYSGLGEKNVPVQGGRVYYLAQFGPTPAVYALAPGQVLVVNQSGRPLAVQMASVSGLIGNGVPALGALDADGVLKVTWDGGTADLKAGGLYRFVLDSPEGTGTTVALAPWD